ncbi:hypothetical protein Pmar_PMAR016690, partial [Perkinsus marinus ATCC 50983]
ICAVKTIKLRDESEGIPASVLREVGLLQALHHPNIVELHCRFGSLHRISGIRLLPSRPCTIYRPLYWG